MCKAFISAVEAMLGPIQPGRPVIVPTFIVEQMTPRERDRAAQKAARCGVRWRIAG
jgi:hypothetical protein